jgi:hypothetical protein
MKFSCLVTNPPYQDSSHTEKKNTLWRKWLDFESLVNDNGVFCLHHPSSWMGSKPILTKHFLKKSKVKNNIVYINRDECKRHYPGIGSFFSYYVIVKQPYNNQTTIKSKNMNGEIVSLKINLNEVLIDVFPRDLSQVGVALQKKLFNLPKLGILNNTYCHGVKKTHWRTHNEGQLIYPIQRNMKQVIFFDYPHPDQNTPKLLIPTTTHYKNMFITTNGPSQSFCYFNIPEHVEPNVVLHNINNKLFDYLNECFRYSNWNSVQLLRKLPRIPFNQMMTDQDVYDFFELTPEEINHIETIVTWR